ncbi:MAG TPA: hypothetical protein VMW03_03500 [Candidatus Krumholzibacteriaceae bacterium]|nr:hypothetical protein [Candidatus Krumholzibacteriaceae bacterium]
MKQMAWREKYVGWYRLVEEELGGLVPSPSEREIMENVSTEDVLIVPLGEPSVADGKPLPSLRMRLRDQGLELAIVYESKKSVEHLENVYRETHREEYERLFTLLGGLHAGYETKLYSRSGEGSDPELTRRYLSSRLDGKVLRRLLEEADELRKGGRRIVNNQSVYVQPQATEVHLASVSNALNQEAFRETLREIKPLIELLSGIKTQREIIRERLGRPRKERNVYREFVDALNEAKTQGMISAERRRELDKRWRQYEDERDELLREVRALLSPQGR